MTTGIQIYDESGNITLDSTKTTAFYHSTVSLAAGVTGTLEFPELAGRTIIPIAQPNGGLDSLRYRHIFHYVTAVDNGSSVPKVSYLYPDYGRYQLPNGNWLPYSVTKKSSELSIFVVG